jgi:hypothetical protein
MTSDVAKLKIKNLLLEKYPAVTGRTTEEANRPTPTFVLRGKSI